MSSATHLPPAEYEPRDAPPAGIFWTAVGLAGSIAVVFAISAWFYVARYEGHPRSTGIARQTSFQNSPQARTEIAADWQRQDAAVHEHLQTYGWVDRPAGVVRIPIDRAMQLLVEEAKTGRKGSPP